MYKVAFIFIAVSFSYCSYAQSTLRDTVFFNKKWERTTNSKKILFYRPPIQKLEDGRYEIKDYYADNNQVQMWAVFNDTGAESHNGFCRYYYKNGKLSSEGELLNCIRNGHFVDYDTAGRKVKEQEYSFGLPKSEISYYPSGYKKRELFSHGGLDAWGTEYYDSGYKRIEIANYNPNDKSANIKAYYRSGKLMGEGTMKNGKPEIMRVYKENGEIQPNIFDKWQPQFKYGSYQHYFSENQQYPMPCWKNRIEGDVHVKTFFDESGKIYKTIVVKSVHPPFG